MKGQLFGDEVEEHEERSKGPVGPPATQLPAPTGPPSAHHTHAEFEAQVLQLLNALHAAVL